MPLPESDFRARKSVDRRRLSFYSFIMQTLTENQMIHAMQTNDSRYDGRFFVGVHSTGIYCLPSCRARLPRLKNVRFYQTREEALAAGLRGCKRCRSDRYPDILPDWVKRLIAFMRDNRTARITEQMLVAEAGVDITTIRRHFKAQVGLTPLAFNRRQRLLFAKQLIESGIDCLNAGYECGFESSSGFRSAFVRQFGKPPGEFYAHQ